MDARGSRKTIGLIVDMFVSWGELDYYQTKILRGVDDFCRERDLDLLVFVTGHLDSPFEWEKTRNVLFDFVSSEIADGVIVLPSAIGVYASRDRLERAIRSFGELPLVTLGDRFEGLPSVSVDNRGGMKAVVDHLIERHGKRRVAFIRGIEGNTDAEARFGAYRESLSEHGIPFDPDLVAPGNFLFDSGKEAIGLFEERKIAYDAIAAANDNMAIGALLEMGRRGDDAFPVGGFDDAEGGKLHALTTVSQPFREQGYVGARVLLELIEGREVPLETLVPASLITRSSCGCVSDAVASFLGGGSEGVEVQGALDKLLGRLEDASAKAVAMKELALHTQALGKVLAQSESADFLDRFVAAWNAFMRWAGRNEIGVSMVSALVSDFRRGALERVVDAREAIGIDSAFLAMVTQLCERMETQSAFIEYDSAIARNEIDEFGEALFREIDIERQMDLAFERLPGFGIRTCFVARYLDPARPLDGAKSLLAFAGGERFEAGREFGTRSLFPPPVAAGFRKERRSLVIQDLHCGERQIGYLATGIDEKAGRRLELIRYRLGIGLEGALAVEKLEEKVRERTSELLEANERLSRSLSGNEVLLRELQHRVKNNLGVVASLLSLGSSTIEDEGARKVLRDAQTRIHSMSEIYEQLYRKPELASDIELSSYLGNLARSLFATYAVGAERISLVIDAAVLRIDMKRAISLGLIVNELISNALKYAWPSGTAGELRIALSQSGSDYLLSVSDDGIGIGREAIEGNTGSLGMTIVRMLGKDLSAKLSYSGEGGTRVELRIPVAAKEN